MAADVRNLAFLAAFAFLIGAFIATLYDKF
jgi:hypothetical protein